MWKWIRHNKVVVVVASIGVCNLLFWTVSLFFGITWMQKGMRRYIVVYRGAVTVELYPASAQAVTKQAPEEWHFGSEKKPPAIIWLHSIRPSRGPFQPSKYDLPLWYPLVPVFIGLAVVSCRKRSHEKCSKCQYDLAGLPVGVPCPECGRPAAQPDKSVI